MSAAAHALPRGELVLDRYRPLRPLGSGGSGSVWLARDERNGLDVALKIVPREGKAAHRAEREAEAAARLRHERCLRAYGFGSDSGHVYIAYEYVGGRTLREAMRSGELRDGQAIEAAAQILDGLAHAHGRGIVHRDVKPSNVLLAEDDAISVRLLDFGLAQFDEAETLTAVGDVPGTLAYISPERLRGEEACSASDVWAVGILLWEALAGKHPFWGVPLPQMAGTIESGCPPLQPERPDLPKRLLAAISHAVAHDPGKRPPRSGAGERVAFGARRGQAFDERRKCCFRHKALVPRLAPAALAGAAALAGGMALPFYPTGWAPALAAAAAFAAFRSPRAGLALALAAPVLPLGNHALGLALLYGVLAARLARSLAGETPAGGSRSSRGLHSRPSGCSRSSRSRSQERAAPSGAPPIPSPPSPSRRSWQGCAGSSFRSPRERRRRSTWRAPRAPPAPPARSSRPFRRAWRSPPAVLPRVAAALPYARTPWRIAGIGVACSRPRCCSSRPRPQCRSCSPPGSPSRCWH